MNKDLFCWILRNLSLDKIMLLFNIEINMIMTEVAVAALLMLMLNNIYIPNSSHILLTEFLLNLINQI